MLSSDCNIQILIFIQKEPLHYFIGQNQRIAFLGACRATTGTMIKEMNKVSLDLFFKANHSAAPTRKSNNLDKMQLVTTMKNSLSLHPTQIVLYLHIVCNVFNPTYPTVLAYVKYTC